MKKLHTVVLAIVAAVALEGCSASRALDQPHEKDLNVLKPGTDRDLVRAELGAPLPSAAGATCDVFAFPEGSTGWRYMRALSYSVLDVGTLGLAEIVTNPVESSVGKGKVQLRICYTANQAVAYTERLEIGQPTKLVTGSYPPPPPAVETAPLAAVDASTAADPAAATPAAPEVTATPPASTPASPPAASAQAAPASTAQPTAN
jgi:hypothetical protein